MNAKLCIPYRYCDLNRLSLAVRSFLSTSVGGSVTATAGRRSAAPKRAAIDASMVKPFRLFVALNGSVGGPEAHKPSSAL